MTCIEEMAANIATNRNEEPMDNATHVMLRFSAQPKKEQDELYRADGMLIACRQGERVSFGNDIATAQTRTFMSFDSAYMFLRRMADLDLIAGSEKTPIALLVDGYLDLERFPVAAVIDERNAESLISMPGKHSGIDMARYLKN